jgi:hypothetical protein
MESEDWAMPVRIQSLGLLMITLAEAQDLYNRGELPYYNLTWATNNGRKLRRDFVAWRMEVLGGVCPVCEQPLDPANIEIDHQHPMDRKRYPGLRGLSVDSGDNLRGYVRDILHRRCNRAVCTMERGLHLTHFPAHLVYWYRIAYARVDEARRRRRR